MKRFTMCIPSKKKREKVHGKICHQFLNAAEPRRILSII